MRFDYTKHHLSRRAARQQRLLEILPGLTSWSILLGVILFSILKPILAAVLIIAFYLFWLMRLLYMTIFLALSYFRLSMEKKTNWRERIEHVDHLNRYLSSEDKKPKGKGPRQRLSHRIHVRELSALQKNKNHPPLSKNIYHLILYPVVKERGEIVEPGLKSLLNQDFPKERMAVFLAVEERAEESIKNDMKVLVEKYASKFFALKIVWHPKDIAGEALVKGANITCAAKKAADFFQEKNIPFDDVLVSCFDADTVVSPHYFSALTYYFLITPKRLRASFQPIPVYHNNIWEVPGFARVIETGSSFFQLTEATNPEKLSTFSSHSMSFKALMDVGCWPVDMISDDSAIYWKSLIHFDGDYRVVPMSTTISMDIAGSENLRETAESVYKQKRRWAWGVENFPIVMRAFLRPSQIPLRKRCGLVLKLFEGHVSWATWGFLLSILGWLPALFARQEYLTSVAYFNVPRISRTIFQLAGVSLITSIILSIQLLPKSPQRTSWKRKFKHAFEWLTIPVILVLFSSLPSLDAQTRMMLGRRMEFWVTDKKRKK